MKRKNAVREARRQHHLSRMSHRTGSEAAYVDQYDGKGNIVSSKYVGHVEVPMRRLFPLKGCISRVIVALGVSKMGQEFVAGVV